MTPAHRTSNLIGVIVPLLAVFAAHRAALEHAASTGAIWSCSRSCTWSRGFGVTRRLPPDAHPPLVRDLQARPVRCSRSSARWRSRARSSRGSPTTASTTRTPTQEGDPHSPHGHGSGFKGAVKGLWYAHMGWLFDRQGQAVVPQVRPRPRRGPRLPPSSTRSSRSGSRSGSRSRPPSAARSTARSRRALTGALWGGAVRIFLLHHVTWSINSVCHFFGSRRFEVDDHSTNVFWLAPLSFGESWHHNHHAFPRSAMHGLRWWEVDPTAWVIRGDEGDQAGLERRRDHARSASSRSWPQAAAEGRHAGLRAGLPYRRRARHLITPSG